MRSDLANLLRRRHGHFELESGHHGDLWLDLESLCARPSAVRPLAAELALRLRRYKPEVICGPLVEGAFIGIFVAAELDVGFIYAEPLHAVDSKALFPVAYRIPQVLRSLQNRRVAVVNDVINAGSAVRGTLKELAACNAKVVAIGTLLSLGPEPARLANAESLPLESLETEPNTIWLPSECPVCAAGVPLIPFASTPD